MIQALLLGSLAALLWGATALTSAPASRLAGPWRAMLWTSLAAIAATGLAALATGPPGGSLGEWGLVALSGTAYAVATACWLFTVRGGEVSLVTPIIACDGAIAALIAVAAGESLSAPTAVALAAMVTALLMVAREEGAPPAASEARYAITTERSSAATVSLAAVTAVLFAIVFYTSGKVEGIGPLWVVATARMFPFLCGLAVCLRAGSVLPPRETWPWLLSCGITDAAGFVCYVIGAQGMLAVAAVAASQYGAVAAVGGVLLLGEHLRRRQWVGVVVLIAAAGTIAGTS